MNVPHKSLALVVRDTFIGCKVTSFIWKKRCRRLLFFVLSVIFTLFDIHQELPSCYPENVESEAYKL